MASSSPNQTKQNDVDLCGTMQQIIDKADEFKQIWTEKIDSWPRFDIKDISQMTETELNEYEKSLYDEIKKVHHRQDELYKPKHCCKVCKQKSKNVVIIDCGHFNVCSDCEKAQEKKICNTCFKEYSNTVIIQL